MFHHYPQNSHHLFVQLPPILDSDCPWTELDDASLHPLAQSFAGAMTYSWETITFGIGSRTARSVRVAQTKIRLDSTLPAIEKICEELESCIQDSDHDRLIIRLYKFLTAVSKNKNAFYPSSPKQTWKERAVLAIETLIGQKAPSQFIFSGPEPIVPHTSEQDWQIVAPSSSNTQSNHAKKVSTETSQVSRFRLRK